MRHTRALTALAAGVVMTGAGAAVELRGTVHQVIDGDTVYVVFETGTRPEIVRLLGYQDSEEDIANLGMFEATVLNRQHRNVLVQTLPYAAYIILNFVRENEGATLADLEAVDGLDPTRLDPQFLVNHLRAMGLLVEKNGVLQYSGLQD